MRTQCHVPVADTKAAWIAQLKASFWCLLALILLLASPCAAHRRRHSTIWLQQVLQGVKHSQVANPHHKPQLCAASRSLDIVLSRYHEDFGAMNGWLTKLLAAPAFSGLTYCIYLYDKGPDDLDEVARALPVVDYLTRLPNLAREGHTYLTHIISNYYSLPHHMLFSQAYPNDVDRNMLARIHLFNPTCTRFLCLGAINTCGCEGCHMPFRMVAVREVWAMVQYEFCSQPFEACMEGQFVVSRAAVHSHRLQLYLTLYMWLTGGPEHYSHHDFEESINQAVQVPSWAEDLEEGRLTGDNVYFSHVLERVWSPIFNCTNADTSVARIAWDLATTGRLQSKRQHCEQCGGTSATSSARLQLAGSEGAARGGPRRGGS